MSDQDDDTPEAELAALRFSQGIAESELRAASVHPPNVERAAAARARLGTLRTRIAQLERTIRADTEAEAERAAENRAKLERRREEFAGMLPVERFKAIRYAATTLQSAANDFDLALERACSALHQAATQCTELEMLTPDDDDLRDELAAAWADLRSLAAYWLAPAGVDTGASPRRGSFASRLPRPDDWDEDSTRPRRRRSRASPSPASEVPDLARAIEEGRTRGARPPGKPET